MSSIQSIDPSELSAPLPEGKVRDLVDVRSPMEFATVHADGARLIPLGSVTAEAVRAGRPANAVGPTYVICHSGGRSRRACAQLLREGMQEVVHVEGGTSAWIAAGLPVVRGAGLSGWVARARQLGLVVMLLFVGLAWFVHPGFAFAALGTWLALVVAGRGACPLGACSVPAGREAAK